MEYLVDEARGTLVKHATKFSGHVLSIVVHQLVQLHLDLIERLLSWRAIVKHLFGLLIVDNHDSQNRRQGTFNLQQSFQKRSCCLLAPTLI